VEAVLIALGLIAFGALVGRVWVLALVAAPFAVVAVFLRGRRIDGGPRPRDGRGDLDRSRGAADRPRLLVATAVGVALGYAARAGRSR
jgi:hypothetical protein